MPLFVAKQGQHTVIEGLFFQYCVPLDKFVQLSTNSVLFLDRILHLDNSSYQLELFLRKAVIGLAAGENICLGVVLFKLLNELWFSRFL